MCFKDKDTVECSTACNVVLLCGHECQGSCGKCRQGRLHMMCTKPCNRTLVCGHQCNWPCTKDCPPCSKICTQACIHSACKKK